MSKEENREVVTIVTPSYNQGKYIEETILSVLDQDYPNIEYIVMDGGSTDETVEILKKYSERLTWVSEKDGGQSDALVKGFGRATGEIFGWVNSDDKLLPGAVSEAAGYLAIHSDIGMVYGKGYNVDVDGEILEEYPTEEFDLMRLAKFNYITQPAAFFKREAYEGVGGLDKELHYTMDYDLWMRIGRKFKVVHLPGFYSATRLHMEAKTISGKHEFKKQEECLQTIRRNYGWAPLKSVFVYYNLVVQKKLPQWITGIRPLGALITIIVSSFAYIIMNRGIRFADIRTIPEDLKKLRGGWRETDRLKLR